MHKLKLPGLSILSGLLMGVSWPATGNLAPIFFIALLPLLYVEYTVFQNKEKYKSRHLYFYSFLCYLTFNTYTTWWIWYASDAGMIMAVVLNSIFMAIVFLWFHKIKKRFGSKKGYLALIFFWVAFEWLHYHWEFSHPWSSFGNTFANYTTLIQWYEYTGVLGGTIWILVVNILFFELYRRIAILKERIKSNLKLIYTILGVIIIPIISSVVIYNSYEEPINENEIVIVQPNIDPYRDKFGRMTEEQQIDRILNLARKKITPQTKFLVAPETALARGGNEAKIEFNIGIIKIRELLKEFPNLNVIIGASTYKEYQVGGKKPTSTARQNKADKIWYDAFNSAFLIEKDKPIQIYHKSKLVLGVERLPFAKLLAPLENFAINLGGTMGSLGTEKEAKNFLVDSLNIAPVICYESIYGDYVGDYINKGANLIFIITNDGWWDDTPGYKQHLAYARIRAIENRRSIARSANTGISCFINQKGDVFSKTKWWQQDAIIGNINNNDQLTFYSIYGDYFGRTFAAISVILLIWYWTLSIKKKLNPF